MQIRLVTDSNAMLPEELRERFGITVVPLTVVIDGQAHSENTLDPDDFCRRLRDGASVTTAAPSPGEILAAFDRAAAAGADAVLSIHVGSNRSATVDAARLAASQAAVPVTVVDTGTASFIEGCCVWRAAEQLAGGATLAQAEVAALEVAASSASVFTIGELDRANDGGRFAVTEGPGVPLYCSRGPDLSELPRAKSIDEATRTMVDVIADEPGPLRVGVGDAGAPEAAHALHAALIALPNVAETIRYCVGPSVAAHTGAGTFGAVYHRLVNRHYVPA